MVHLPYKLLGYLNANLLGKSTATNSLLIFLAEGLQIHVSRWCSAGQSLYIKAATFGSRKSCLSSSSAHCLAVLFEYFIDEASPSAKCSSAVDVGSCKPVCGSLLARSFRGRDRRKMISWKDMACTSGYPY
ncbi:hypothetical protein Peur_010833 [Populus x canadensis]